MKKILYIRLVVVIAAIAIALIVLLSQNQGKKTTPETADAVSSQMQEKED